MCITEVYEREKKDSVSEYLVINAKWTICQLYHYEYKQVMLNEIMSALY